MPDVARLDRRCLCFAGIVAYVFFGLVIVVVNKSIVRDHGLRMPALVASMGALFTATLTRVLVLLGKVHVRPVGKQPWEFALWRVLPVGVCAAGSLCFGNMAYIFLDAGFIQMLKAGTPALLLLVLACLKVEVVSGKAAALALCMVAGSALASAQQPNATVVGLTVQLLSQLCEVLQCTGMQVFLQQLGFDAWDAGYYLTPAVAACCLLPSIVLEWPHIIAQQKVQLLFDQAPMLLLSGCVGVVVNLSSLLVIKHTSSLLAKLLVIFRSAALVLLFILGGEEFTALQIAGYVATICAFVGYSVVKAREAQEGDSRQEDSAAHGNEREMFSRYPDSGLEAAPEASVNSLPREISRTSNEGLLDEHRAASEESSATPPEAVQPSWDVTTFLFWFALFVFFAGAYQAVVVRDLPTSALGLRGLVQSHRVASASTGVPPAPDLASATGDQRGEPSPTAAWQGAAAGSSLAGPSVVQTSAKVLHLTDGRFLVHRGDEVALQARQPGSTFSSSWVVSSQDFGLVRLQTLGGGLAARWLSCNLSLTAAIQDACELWMTASSWERWSPAEDVVEYVLKRRSTGLFLEADGPILGWGQAGSTFHVADWMPEECSLKGMMPSHSSYMDASREIAFTMTTFSRVYARNAMFRQALSSAFMHLKERDFYISEFLVVDEWFEGPSLLAGTFSGPTVESTRAEMLDFFPGCNGATLEEAEAARGRCTFVFKDRERRGQASSLNILLDLMRAKFWMHLEDDWVFYRDVYLSQLLAPMFEHPDSCWRQEHGQGRDAIGAEAPAGGCTQVAAVRLESRGPSLADAIVPAEGPEVEEYHMSPALLNDSYVREFLAHGGVDDDPGHSWGAFEQVGAAPWPPFPLRPALHNLTYIRSLGGPLFYGGKPGRFSEDPRINRWRDGGRAYSFRWGFQLEFAVRWARGGASVARVNPGACVKDVSTGVSSLERSFVVRPA